MTTSLKIPASFIWSVRRELWENRSITIAPVAVAAVALFGFLISTHHLAENLRDMAGLDPAQQAAELFKPYGYVAIAIMFTNFIVGAFYCLGALHGERRDRSILFWKSLPVSDLTTVLAKACIPFVVLPAIGFVVILATQAAMLVLSTVVLLMGGENPSILWSQLPLSGLVFGLFRGLIVCALWHAPVYGWLLAVSAWARRATFLWAVLPPLGLCVVEKFAFGTQVVSAQLGNLLIGCCAQVFDEQVGNSGAIAFAQTQPFAFLALPSLWIGLVVAAALIAAAVRLRRNREPI